MSNLDWERRLKHTTRINAKDSAKKDAKTSSLPGTTQKVEEPHSIIHSTDCTKIKYTSIPMKPPCCNSPGNTPLTAHQTEVFYDKQAAERQDKISKAADELKEHYYKKIMNFWLK